MEQIDIREWKTRGEEVMRAVREGAAAYEITFRGEVIARVDGGAAGEERRRESLRLWEEMKLLGEELSRSWPEGVSAVEAVREQRRDF